MLYNVKSIWNHRPLLLLLFFISLSSFFPHLGELPADLMEARNFVTAREIVQNGEWLVPTLNGEPRIAKPPLPTWLTAIAYILGGRKDDNGLLRLPAALMGMVLVFAAWGLVRCLSRDDHLAFICAAVSATSLLVMNMSRCGSWDIYCHGFMLMAIWAFAEGWGKPSKVYLPFIWGGFLMGFSLMSKGPVAFFTMLLPFGIAYGIAIGHAGIIRQIKPLLLAAAIAGAVGGLWPTLIFFKMPHISTAVASTEATSWLIRHQRPFYFYAHFPIYTGLWGIVAAAALFLPFAGKKIRQVGHYRFWVLWIFISLALLSIVPEKKERYLLPTIIPTAILTGHLWYALIVAAAKKTLESKDIGLLYFHSGITVVAALAAPFILFGFGVSNRLLTFPAGVTWSVIFGLSAILTIGAALKKSAVGIFGTGILFTVLVNWAMLPCLYHMMRLNYDPAMHPLRETRSIESIQALPFYATEELNPKNIWEIGKVVTTWKIRTTARPTRGSPLALFSPYPIVKSLWPKRNRRISITPIGRFNCDPKDPSKYMHLAIIKFLETDTENMK